MKKTDVIKKIKKYYLGPYGYTFEPRFKELVLMHVEDYEDPKSFFEDLQFEDLQSGGCSSGMIWDFIYHSDCKEFYVRHLDDLENFKNDEEMKFDRVAWVNKDRQPHYTFMCWSAFEQYCKKLYNNIYGN
jgi:hypothetical protein